MPSTTGSPCNNSSQVHTALASGVPGGDSAYLLNCFPGSFWQEWRVPDQRGSHRPELDAAVLMRHTS
ncbi:hypothetical protein [Kitasatospora sp. NPDC087314]|uniref:hypothetical protein n=1 Tax=Kitasatospora sp. NPDC087314 TaxID=3364068 RepID=UPI00382E95BD